jgi:hypothetical protein
MERQWKRLSAAAVLVVVVVTLYTAGYIPYDRHVLDQTAVFSTQTGTAPLHFGHIEPMVKDGFTETPLEGAVIVIPETGQRFYTGADGRTASIRISIPFDSRFEKTLPKPWGEVTLLVYLEGYIDYALFSVHVWENQARKGPVILLFPEVPGSASEPFVIVEGPHRMWVTGLLDKYRPQGPGTTPRIRP